MVIWKDVVGYEGIYKVSESGEVKSLERFKKCGHKDSKPQIVKEKILKERICRMGYPQVKLSKDGKAKLVRVHRILALAFIPNPENKPNINHIDGNTKNKSISNLEWCTQKENVRHAWDLGLCKVHQDRSLYRANTKINIDIAEKIREERIKGLTLKEISSIFDISVPTVSMVCNNKIWGKLK